MLFEWVFRGVCCGCVVVFVVGVFVMTVVDDMCLRVCMGVCVCDDDNDVHVCITFVHTMCVCTQPRHRHTDICGHTTKQTLLHLHMCFL